MKVNVQHKIPAPEDICTPYLLIIDCEEMPSKEWVRNQQGRVDKVLADYCKEHDIKP